MKPSMRMLMISNRDNAPSNVDSRKWTITENGYHPQYRGDTQMRGPSMTGQEPYIRNEPHMGGYDRTMRGQPSMRDPSMRQPSMRDEPHMGGYNNHMDDYDPYMGDEPEMKYEMPESRRYKNGRFAPTRSEYDVGMHYGERQHHDKMQIGFAGGSEQEMPLSQMTAEKWVRDMEGEDGKKGPHWSADQVRAVMKQKDIKCDPWEFYAAINAMYSDYKHVFEKYGLGENVDVYVEMAKAFIDDKDAQPDKLARYYKYIVKK